MNKPITSRTCSTTSMTGPTNGARKDGLGARATGLRRFGTSGLDFGSSNPKILLGGSWIVVRRGHAFPPNYEEVKCYNQ